MPNTAPDPSEEPLDPKVEEIRKKLVRLLMVSGGIMMVGLATVLIAIVYRLNSVPEDANANAATAPGIERGPALLIQIPKGSRITDSTMSAQGLTLTITTQDGQQSIRFYNTKGALVRTFEVQEGP
ncbi:MAG: fimbrial protein [Pseudomonadota bacterium]